MKKIGKNTQPTSNSRSEKNKNKNKTPAIVSDPWNLKYSELKLSGAAIASLRG